MNRSTLQTASLSMAATAFVGMAQMLTRTGCLPPSLYYANMLFAIAIPFLVASALIPSSRIADGATFKHWYPVIVALIAWVLVAVGVGLLFWYLSGALAVAFVIAGVLALLHFFACVPGQAQVKA